ncbi:hypothetical protein Q31b_28420 [Novipirellula aureliae]|uniref:Uncharacterized protein n=1 Tax=Novipirellula aureliae TaxID=2527966 RepID=A0A5C6DXK8_9BACT|nr:hypothetical protein Q31b_28420 [Novipirellula aureliae]
MGVAAVLTRIICCEADDEIIGYDHQYPTRQFFQHGGRASPQRSMRVSLFRGFGLQPQLTGQDAPATLLPSLKSSDDKTLVGYVFSL